MRRKVWMQRQRAAVVWAGIAFIALQVGFGTAVESRLIDVRDNTNYSYRAGHLRQRLAREQAAPLTVVMFGSSRAMNAWQAGELEQPLRASTGRPVVAYNFGVRGGGHIYSSLSLRKLVAEGTRPDVVLIELFPPFLGEQADTELRWLAANELRSREFELDEWLGLKSDEVQLHWTQRWLTPLYTHRVYLLNRACPQLLPHELRANWLMVYDDSGWVAHNKPPQKPGDVEKTRRMYAANFTGFRLGGPSCRALRETLEFCRHEQISCGLVMLPEASQVRGWCSPEMQIQVDQFLRTLAAESSVTIIDARDWLPDEQFSDGNHLRVAGADAFSQRLNGEFLPSLVAQARRPGSTGALAAAGAAPQGERGSQNR
jgi:hypothetical protein